MMSNEDNERLQMYTGLLKREIEDLPVVSSLSFIHTITWDKAGYRDNLRCHVASSPEDVRMEDVL
jgi:hypothetical protein